jgi:hypothetical protein
LPNDYRRENLLKLKKNYLRNHNFYKLNMRGLPDEVLDNLEPQIIDAAISEAQNPNNVPLGELRQIDKLDTYGNLRERRFIGQECFVKFADYGNRAGRRVASFTTDKGRFDAAKGKWF